MRSPFTWLSAVAVVIAFAPASAHAQTAARPGSLRFVIRDATDLAVAGAIVTVTPSSTGTAPRTVQANERGEATVANLAPGGYVARIESPGFTPIEIGDLRVRSGAQTSRTVSLVIATLSEEIDVSPAAEDTQLLGAFTEQLSVEQIAALPDDPDELAEVLQQLIGEDADIRVNGFAGGRLPPGTQIQDIRVRYDAASGTGNGGPRVEIRSRPGSGRWQNTFNMNMRDESLNARQAFSDERSSGQTRQYAYSLNGPLVKNRTGISVSVDRAETQEQQAIRAARLDGIFSALISQPSTRTGVRVELEHALTSAQELRTDINFRQGNSLNQGISEFDLPERAFSRTRSDGEIRVGHRSTIRKQWVNNLRLQYRWNSSNTESASDAMTIRVLDAFTTGGAQAGGGRRTRDFEIENELEFTFRKSHQMAFGASANGNAYSVDEVRNVNGTFTFASLEMYRAGLPTTYTQRVINPHGSYSLQRYGWYLQDSYRVNRSVMINLALRHDLQTRLSDWMNFSPRIGASWTLPGRRTTLRASLGVWPQFFEGGLYEQTLWANGQQQRDVVISAPGYPDPFTGGVPLASQPPSLVRADPGIVMPYTQRVSIGVDRTFSTWARIRANYSHGIGRHLFRSRDLNAPVDGVRPEPGFRNITLLETTARSLNRSLEINLMLNHRPRRFSGNVGYRLGESLNESDGGLSLPPNSVDLSQEWGPSRQDIRHRLFAAVNTDVKAGFRVNMHLRAQSAAPYNITTGLDENRDGQTNERPDGVSRNAGRGSATTNLDLGLTWSRSVGQRPAVNLQRGGGGGGGRRGSGSDANAGIFRFEIFARASNVLNRVNPQNFSGVLTSPFFGRATSASAPRRVVIGMRAFF
jgi:hypothetical protein